MYIERGAVLKCLTHGCNAHITEGWLYVCVEESEANEWVGIIDDAGMHSLYFAHRFKILISP